MKILMEKNTKKRIGQISLFGLIMVLTFYTFLKGQNPGEIFCAVRGMTPGYLLLAGMLALFFVCAEGTMIWYLLRSMTEEAHKEDQKSPRLLRCIQYSFIGFFYSGITPSATGGQPVQLYYMNKDGHKGADSTVVLMSVAAVYKFVLVLIGVGILVFWREALIAKLNNDIWLYLLGLLLNVIVVAVILCVMLFPKMILEISSFFETQMIRRGLWEQSETRREKIVGFVDSYRNAVGWMKKHPFHLLTVIGVTFLQRCSVFVLTYVVYLGLGQQGTGAMEVILLQAAIYISVDMLPLPGAQGITELMYRTVYTGIFTGSSLIPSMLVTRGLNFYFLLLVSLIVVGYNRYRDCLYGIELWKKQNNKGVRS